MMKIRVKTAATSPLEKKAKRGHRGYPAATVAYYGPTSDRASKVVVGIVEAEGEPTALERWFSDGSDVRQDRQILSEIMAFIERHGAK
jgi:hypothetical protein